MGGVSQYCLGYASYPSVPGQVRQLCPCQILPSMATSQEESAAMVVLILVLSFAGVAIPVRVQGWQL